jgi:hypothetical protein
VNKGNDEKLPVFQMQPTECPMEESTYHCKHSDGKLRGLGHRNYSNRSGIDAKKKNFSIIFFFIN